MWLWCSKKSWELEMQLSEMPVCSFGKSASVGERARGLGAVRREGHLGLSPCTHSLQGMAAQRPEGLSVSGEDGSLM